MKHRLIGLAFMVVLLTFTCRTDVFAGDINSSESAVIGVAGGTFEYNGKTYVAKQTYINQLVAKLSQDGVDLTEAQASQAISAIYANVANGVSQGYLEEVAASPQSDDTAGTGEETPSQENPENPEATEVQTEASSETEAQSETETLNEETATEETEPESTTMEEETQKSDTQDKKTTSNTESKKDGIDEDAQRTKGIVIIAVLVLIVVLLLCVYIMRKPGRKGKR